jgi:hypothetical protein
LGHQLDLTPGEITRAFSMFSESQTGYRPSDVTFEPKDVIISSCNDLGFSQAVISDILDLSARILKKEPRLAELTPLTVAGGMIYYHLKISSTGLELQELSGKMGLSEATLKTIYERISIVDNS